MDFDCLEKILENALATKPQLMILMGPFLDANNRVIQEGGVTDEHGEEYDLTDIFEVSIKSICSCTIFCYYILLHEFQNKIL